MMYVIVLCESIFYVNHGNLTYRCHIFKYVLSLILTVFATLVKSSSCLYCPHTIHSQTLSAFAFSSCGFYCCLWWPSTNGWFLPQKWSRIISRCWCWRCYDAISRVLVVRSRPASSFTASVAVEVQTFSKWLSNYLCVCVGLLLSTHGGPEQTQFACLFLFTYNNSPYTVSVKPHVWSVFTTIHPCMYKMQVVN